METINPKCPKCKANEKVVKRGLSPTKQRGKQQRYLCKSCKHTFILDNGFYKMKFGVETITMSVDMYLSNLSSRKMRNQLKRHFSVKVSHITVLDWVRKYVLKVQRYTEKMQPQLSGQIYADETEIDCEIRNDVFWCAVDWETRFISATLYSPHSQNMRDAREFMRRIRKQGLPKYIQTDGLPFYPRAFRNVFFQKHRSDVEHRVNNVSRTRKHNVRIETVFSKLKDRVYDFRGLKALWSAPILIAGIVIQHNFIETHTTTGQLPCELAGLKLDAGQNRWLGLIRLASAS